MADVSDKDHGFERLAILHFSVSRPAVRVYGQTETGIRVTIDLPVEAVRSAPAVIFDEQTR